MSGHWIELTAADGHKLQGWLAEPASRPKGGVMILQEIFGITEHIRDLVEEYADEGYLALAPALFDRNARGLELSYADFPKARAVMESLDRDKAVMDMQAAADYLRSAGKVAAVGYCWGGAMADLAACRGCVDAAVSYYGRSTVEWLDEKPACPVLYHFGSADMLIPPPMVEQITSGRPGHTAHVYAGANHGFNCTGRPEFHPEAARLALDRTLSFLGTHLAT